MGRGGEEVTKCVIAHTRDDRANRELKRVKLGAQGGATVGIVWVEGYGEATSTKEVERDGVRPM